MEKPILFSGPMVQAILDGRKTQTRRVMKAQPPDDTYKIWTCISTTGNKNIEGKCHWVRTHLNNISIIDGNQPYFSKPYQAGDVLWVRETWRRAEIDTPDGIYYKADDLLRYLDGSESKAVRDGIKKYPRDGKLKPSIFMPRWASRISLSLTGVKVERLQDISDEDAIDEGVDENPIGITPKTCFRILWDSINKKRGYGWDTNPWVWKVEFKPLVEAGK